MLLWINAMRDWLFGESVSSSSTIRERLSDPDHAFALKWEYKTQSSPDVTVVSGLPVVTATSAKDNQQRGYDFMQEHLSSCCAVDGEIATALYALGAARAARDEALSVLGDKKIFEYFQRMADDVLDPTLPKGK